MLKNSQIGKSTSNFIGKTFSFIPLHPNYITVLAVLLSVIAFFIWDNDPLLSFILFLVAFFFDIIDGAIARFKNLTSKKGAFLDGISDRVVEFFLILVLFKVSFPDLIPLEIHYPLLFILFFGTCMTVFVKTYAHHHDLIKKDSALHLIGFMERAERSILLLIILGLFLFNYGTYATGLVYFTAVLSLATFLQRMHLVLK